MKTSRVVSAVFLLLSSMKLGIAQSQQPASAVPSLGDLARQLRAERAKAAQKPEKIYSNDNLPARPPKEGLTAAGGMVPEAAEQPVTKGEATPSPGEPSAEAHNEKYYRAKMSELRSQLELHQRELDVQQQKLSQNEMQYYPDPNKALVQEYTRADVNKRTQDVDKKKEEIAADEKAMDDLRDQLRREGGDPGWLR